MLQEEHQEEEGDLGEGQEVEVDLRSLYSLIDFQELLLQGDPKML